MSEGFCVKPMNLVMDDHGAVPHPRSSGLRVSTKSKAPSPPGLKKLDSPGLSQWFPGNPPLTMDQKENLIDKDLSLVVVLPGGEEKTTSVHGSQPLMDLLVTLCAKYRLNPSSHTLELVTTNKKNTKLKPNALIGSLEAEKIILKPKGEDKNKKTGPQMPEATVRMVINYKKTQKTILRVSPRVPLSEHLPAICEKCEFDVESTVLLKDVHSLAPLDLSCSLNDYAIREVYARDPSRQPSTPLSPASPIHAGKVLPGKDKNQKEEENKGLFSKFRKSKKKSDQAVTASAPASPVLVSRPRPLSMALPSSNSSPLGSPTLLDAPKKRRAPQPPVLVSQSSSVDFSPRRRINSEPGTHLDSEQLASLSRGSSAESSLKRTKRKAPPPPASLSAAVQQSIAIDEKSQEAAAAKTLEEIMEQEETTVLVKSVTVGNNQAEDSGVSVSAEVSLHSTSPETNAASTAVVESNGEDHSHDLSSDGNQPQSPAAESAAPSNVTTTEGTDSSEPAEINGSPCLLEAAGPPAVCEESTSEGVKEDSSAVPGSPPLPVMQEVGAHCSVQTETHSEQTDELKIPEVPSTLSPNAEDAQVQTDVMPPPVPPEEPVVIVSSDLGAAEKKDMATSTDELNSPDLKNALPHTSETLSCQDMPPSPPAAATAASIYATDSEPKPKPSNEVTRDYIPKVGMTTYTIVPQKSLEKLRYFEVALTLERPAAAEEAGSDVVSPRSEESAVPREQAEGPKEKSELHSTAPRENVLTSTATAPTQDTVNGNTPAPNQSLSATRFSGACEASTAGSAAQVKPVKIPPATKPKPGSFRLAQHKKTPGYYVTSAAEKNPIASAASVQREAPAGPQRDQLPPPPLPPPHPPPTADTTGACDAEMSPRADGRNAAISRFNRHSSLPSKQPSSGLSLDKLRGFVTPRPYAPTTQSRFAQAVSSAVKRSQSLSHAPKSPHSPVRAPVSPITSHPSAPDSKGSPELKDSESSEIDGDKSSALVEKGEGQSLSGTVLIEGQSSP